LLTTWIASAPAQGQGLVKSYAIENQAYTLSAQGEELSRQGSYGSALALLKQAASFDPTSYSERIHLDMADCYQKMKKLRSGHCRNQSSQQF
jgi:tetratricopeptide (TPR) repeat protein